MINIFWIPFVVEKNGLFEFVNHGYFLHQCTPPPFKSSKKL
jgi:hypothetical protein